MKFIASFFVFVCFLANASVVPICKQANKPVKVTSRPLSMLSSSVQKPSSSASAMEFANRFLELRIDIEQDVPVHIRDALSTIVSYPTGLLVISDIVNELEPKVHYVRSLRKAFNSITLSRPTAEKSLRDLLGIISYIVGQGNFKNFDFSHNYGAVWEIFLKKLELDPSKIVAKSYMGGLPNKDYYELSYCLYHDLLRVILELETCLSDCCFQFKDDGDYYEHETRTIAVTDRVISVDVVSGPRYCILGIVAAMGTSSEGVMIDEKLLHEILHFEHFALRKAYLIDDFSLMAIKLNELGFSPLYLSAMKAAWTNPEEFKTITGLYIDESKGLVCSKKSECRYLSDKRKSFRGAHVSGRYLKVPIAFVNLMRSIGVTFQYPKEKDTDEDFALVVSQCFI